MRIIIEGPDGSGKTTLAKKLCQALNMNYQGSEGPPKYDGEIIDRVERYSTLSNTIFDRHPCVSQPIYGKFRPNETSQNPTYIQTKRFYEDHNKVIIYCPPNHLTKRVDDNTTDTDEYIEWLDANYSGIHHQYDEWALNKANFIYRVGMPMQKVIGFIRSQMSYFVDVCEFHYKFGLLYQGRPRELKEDLKKFRLNFLHEELSEYERAMEENDIEGQLDALVDLVYVALGTANYQGFDFDEAWGRVHQANMRKERVYRAGDSKRNSLYDVVKPEGWVAPDLSDLVK